MIDPNRMIKTVKIFQGANFLDVRSILIMQKVIVKNYYF